MAVPLNRIPSGLLDFFGIKSGEWGPRELGQILQPQIDLFRWYLDNNSLDVLAVVGASPLGASSFAQLTITSTTPVDICSLVTAGQLEVPNNECWLFLEADARWTMSDAAGSCRVGFSSGQVNVTGQAHWNMLTQGWDAGAAGVTRGGCSTLQFPRWVLPGHRVTATMWGSTGGAATNQVTTHMRVARFLR